MLASLAGATALVTGAARRLGRAISLALAEAGVQVVLHYARSKQDVETVAGEIRSMGARAWTLDADLADPEQTEALFQRAVDAAGPVDVLVNNASIFPENRLDSMDWKALEANLKVNAWAPFILMRAMARQNRAGSVVNLIDARIVDRDPAHAAYHMSKRMLFTLTRMAAVEFAPKLRVNAVAPGLVLPPEGKPKSYLDELAHTNPLNRHGDENDVAQAVLFLARSDFITGQVICVDGGRHMRGTQYE